MTNEVRVAVLGGDAREVYIAGRLQALGYQVTLFGAAPDGAAPDGAAPDGAPRGGAAPDGAGRITLAESPQAAVTGANWIVCPSPGLGDGERVYAPDSPVPIILDADLLAASSAAEGGLVLGRATPGVVAAARSSGVSVFEMKDDRALAVSNATAVAEAMIALLVRKTQRVLPEHRLLVLGYGATGAALTDALLGLACSVRVAARRLEHTERARQRGAAPVSWADRVGAMAQSDIVVNTVPSVEAIPAVAFPQLRDAIVADIASPPGGTDHAAASAAGVDLTWARGLAGARAPQSAGDAQLRIIVEAIASRTRTQHTAGTRPPALA